MIPICDIEINCKCTINHKHTLIAGGINSKFTLHILDVQYLLIKSHNGVSDTKNFNEG